MQTVDPDAVSVNVARARLAGVGDVRGIGRRQGRRLTVERPRTGQVRAGRRELGDVDHEHAGVDDRGVVVPVRPGREAARDVQRGVGVAVDLVPERRGPDPALLVAVVDQVEARRALHLHRLVVAGLVNEELVHLRDLRERVGRDRQAPRCRHVRHLAPEGEARRSLHRARTALRRPRARTARVSRAGRQQPDRA